ncbi:MAG TPA: hypothetical protein VES88_14890 [Gemmatimonadaceae bacterium]|nr:hypothetical protein [Gemmatimonadaceae bacterium]
MEIHIDPHTLERAEERGTNPEEISDVISTGFSIPAKHGRIGKAKIYDFTRLRPLLSREPDGHIANSAIGCTAWQQHSHSDTNELTTFR